MAQQPQAKQQPPQDFLSELKAQLKTAKRNEALCSDVVRRLESAECWDSEDRDMAAKCLAEATKTLQNLQQEIDRRTEIYEKQIRPMEQKL